MENRASGILLHISSLPNAYGIGSFGREAYEFVDFLSASGQRYWQLLPLVHTGFGNSPYQAFSTFAGNPLFIAMKS
jgi:4-alpha-glucanotransferase